MATGLAAIGKAAPTASLGIVIVQVVAVPARNRTPKKAFSDSFVCGMIRSPIQKERKGREGKGREGKGREGKGREGKGRDRRGAFRPARISFLVL
ncbi:MAG: hypothetical protein HS102_09800 [Planctomycetia bacterium]|nr:hypothetical protein [Planctomycetia bacterium]